MDFVNAIWAYQFHLIPIAAFILLFEIPQIYRRTKRVAYAPTYFMFFPLGHADHLYSQYFDEHDFYRIHEKQTELDRKFIRKRIMSIAVISMLISTVFTPLFVGTIAGVFLTNKIFLDFVVILLTYKSVTLLISFNNFSQTAIGNNNSKRTLVFTIYTIYLATIFTLLKTSFDWTLTNVKIVGVSGLLPLALKEAVFEILIPIAIIPAVTVAVIVLLADNPRTEFEANDELDPNP